MRSCCRVHVVQATLWHLAEKLIQLRLHKLVLDRVKIVDGHVVKWSHKRVLELCELGVGLALFISRLLLYII